MIDTYANEVDERLTIVATIFLPLSVLGHQAATAALIVESPEGAVREHRRAAAEAPASS
jgi:hypothetical protein